MTRTEIRTFLRSGVEALTPATEFGSGLITDFNSNRSHQYPSVWQNLKPRDTTVDQSAPVNNWEVELIIAEKDAMDSKSEDYEAIVDRADYVAQKLVYQYRNIISGYKMTTMESMQSEPFVKRYADCLTGVMLTFTIVEQDKTNVC